MPFPNKDTQFKPGQSGNPQGVPKGTKHLSTHIQDLLNDEEFETNILDSKVGIRAYKGAPVKAIIEVAIKHALNGDQRWAEWLAKHGYGDKLDITTGGDKLGVDLSADQAEQLIRARANRSDI